MAMVFTFGGIQRQCVVFVLEEGDAFESALQSDGTVGDGVS